MRRIFIIAAGTFLGILAVVLFFTGGFGGSQGWEIDRSVDPMTDAVTAEASLAAAEGNGRLVLSCTDGRAMALLFVSMRRTGGFGDQNYVESPLRYRLDRGPVETTTAVLGDNFIGFGSASDERMTRLLMRLPQASRLSIEFDAPQGGATTMTFDLAGISSAVSQTQSRCRRP